MLGQIDRYICFFSVLIRYTSSLGSYRSGNVEGMYDELQKNNLLSLKWRFGPQVFPQK